MLIFDINSMVEGLNTDSWFELLTKQNLCIYDGQGKSGTCLPPFVVDDRASVEYVAIIDVKTMSQEQLDVLNKAIRNLAEDKYKQNEEAKLLLQQNNERLIKYLKDLNDEVEGKDKDE